MVEGERKVLHVLALDSRPNGEMCLNFAPIMRETGFNRRTVRRYCRSLKRKGFAEFYKGLWTEDGEPAGAGYCISEAGVTEAGDPWLRANEGTQPCVACGRLLSFADTIAYYASTGEITCVGCPPPRKPKPRGFGK